VRERDEAAALCARLHPRVYGSLFLYCGERDVAEELTQETLLRVWQHWPAVSAMDSPERWALRVAFNLVKSVFRRRRVAQRILAVQHLGVAHSQDPADALAMRVAVAGLPPRQRAALVLRYFDDLSVAETARVLGCADGTVKALTSQAVANLRDRFGLPINDVAEDRHG
jgi:RNA polymerase sigma factor (sigma-70 family)